jgi:hypothetical protein
MLPPLDRLPDWLSREGRHWTVFTVLGILQINQQRRRQA